MELAPTRPPKSVARQRWELVRHIAKLLDGPMTVLSFVWLVLLVIDMTRGLTGWLAVLSNVLWGAFVAQFLLEFSIAPSKWGYLRKNWITAVALALPALRVLRVFRAFRLLRAAHAARSTGVLRILTSMNRGIGALRRALAARGFGYVVALTALVTFVGAAGMYNFENPQALRDQGVTDAPGLHSYGEAVWWTAMTMTTMGADYFPKTPEGRLVGWLLALYAFAMFGYITATLASFFIGPKREPKEPPREAGELAALRAEVAALRAQLAELAGMMKARTYDGGGGIAPPVFAPEGRPGVARGGSPGRRGGQ